MPLLTVIALIALPFLEIGLMVLVGSQIGAAWTIVALGALSLAGVLVVRHAGRGAYADLQRALRTGEPPRADLLDTLMLLAGGVLLAVPGFLTGLAGALMALPPTRPALRWAVDGWLRRRLERVRAQMEADLLTLRDYASGAAGPDGGFRPGRGRVIQGRVIHDEPGQDGPGEGTPPVLRG
ncbi:FxsA family protein [Thermobifida cellulosilytica]|uniref:Protein affecting phage T7 exclusion by the F plasmid n=1 Tax=Thermobifida cellulosilytica TB100 TaxID=665004 RepID=A0A147KJR5_THECS|nr:FxsA family protein [Thermobifida cellulosilytica]KUP97459.1 protein affecting phage T7 exclusion by the F plasmid [Thermobifida cellulosilytica TB100]